VLSSMKNGCPVKQIGWIEKNWADLPGKWLASNWKSRIQVILHPVHYQGQFIKRHKLFSFTSRLN